MSTRYSRRSARRQYSEEIQPGEPISSSRRQGRLPRLFSTADRTQALQSAYGRVVARVLTDPYAATEIRRSRPVRRFPAPQVSRKPAFRVPVSLQLQGAKNETFCHKRQTRREVLFSLGVSGRRGGSPGRGGHYRRSSVSLYSCKR